MNQAEIERILEKRIRAKVSWLDGRPRAYWNGGPAAASDILRAHQAELTAAEERLGKMHQQLAYVRNCIEDQPMDGQFKSDLLWDIDQGFSSAPAGESERLRRK